MFWLALGCMSLGVMLGFGILALCASSQRYDSLYWEQTAVNLRRELEVEQGRNCELRASNRELRRRLLAAMDAGYSAEVRS